MSVLKIVQHLPSVSTTDETDTQSTSFIVKSGVYRFAVDPSKGPALIEVGSNPSATGTSFLVHESSEVFLKHGSPKRAIAISATKGATTVFNVRQDGRTPSHPFVVGDYVTVTGSTVTDYNSIVYAQVTAVTDQTVTVSYNSSSAADFTGTATINNSIKYAVKATGAGGALVYATEVQIVGG